MVVCRAENASVRTFWNNDKLYFSIVLDATNPSIGISNARVFVEANNITCTYDRENVVDKQNYFQVTPSTGGVYILTAFGSGDVSYHGNNRAASAMAFDFFSESNNETTTQSPIIDPGNFLEYLWDLIVSFFTWFLSLFGM